MRISEQVLFKCIVLINFIIKHIHISFSHKYFQNYQKIYSVSNYVSSHIYTVCVCLSVCLCIHNKTNIPTSRPFFFFCCPSRRFPGSYLCDHNFSPTTSVTYFDKWNFIRILYDVFKITVLQNVNLKS
jgi:hypothetical protein